MADKSVTIKDATDQQIEELIRRLERESRVQSLISDIKRKSTDGYVSYDQQQGVSTEKPIESLYHFGILGMRWGKRSVGGAPVKNSKKENLSDDFVKKTMLKKKKVSEMSNSELKSLNERLQLERQFKDLTKSESSAGRKFVMDVIAGAAKQTASTYVSKYMSKGVEELLKKTAK